MGRFSLKIGVGLGFCLILWACQKKEPDSITEEELLTEEELALLEEPDLESVEEEIVEADLDVLPEDLPSEPDFPKDEPRPPAEKKGSKPPAPQSKSEAVVNKGMTGDYVIQVGIYKNKAQAEGMKHRLSGMGLGSYIAVINDPIPSMPGTHYRVRFGYFSSIDEANAFADKTIIPKNMEYWVDLKSRDTYTSTYARASAPSPKIEKQAAPEPRPEVSLKPASDGFDDEGEEEASTKEEPKDNLQTKKEDSPKIVPNKLKFNPFKKTSGSSAKKQETEKKQEAEEEAEEKAEEQLPKKSPKSEDEKDSWGDDDDW